MSRKDDLEKQINHHYRRLQLLKEQKARQGISTDPAVITEIEDIEAGLEKLEAELAGLDDEAISTSPGAVSGVHGKSPRAKIPLLQVIDEILIVNVPVGDQIYSVRGPLRLSGEAFQGKNDTVSDSVQPKLLLYDHKGKIIEVKKRASQPAIKYSTKIINKGVRPAEIHQIFIDYGSRDDQEKRIRIVIMQNFCNGQ